MIACVARGRHISVPIGGNIGVTSVNVVVCRCLVDWVGKCQAMGLGDHRNRGITALSRFSENAKDDDGRTAHNNHNDDESEIDATLFP